MPSDTYTLTISDAGVSIPSSHASSHISGGSDVIPTATSTTSGLMSAAIFNQHTANTAKVSNVTHTGDVTDASGVLTVNKINGVDLSSFPNNTVLKTTTGGIIAAATANDFPILNQSTLGNATTATTATNIAGGSAGAVPYQTGSGTTALLGAGTAGYVLKSNGSAAPLWGQVNLSSETTGTLPVSSGGSGATTFTAGILRANGTSAFTTVAAPTGNLVGTTDAQTLTNKTFGTGTIFSTAIGVASGGTGAATFTAGILRANGTSAFTTVAGPTGDIVGTTDTQTLTNKTFGTGTTFSTTIGVSSGGTGATTFAAGFLKASGTSAFTTVAGPTGDIVGTTDTQTLTNKTFGTGTTLSGAIISLTSNVTGTLPVANGGTGASTLTGYVKGTGTTAMTASATIPVSDISGTLPIANGGTANDGTAVTALTFDTLKFKTTGQSSGALSEGQLRWNGTDKTLDLKMAGTSVTQQIGQEVLMRAIASQNILNGQVVYIDGSFDGLPEVGLASNDSLSSKSVVGIATENINIGESGYITLSGLVRNLNLTGYTAGQEVWLSTNGGITATEPSYPAYKVRVGYVAHADSSNGVLYAIPKYFENGLVNGTGKIGYVNGSGGIVTQNTSKSTGVTLNTTNGHITMNAAALAANTTVSFTLTNSKIEAGDVLILNHISGGTNFASYVLNARSAAGSATIDIRNVSSSSLSEAIVIAFVVIKSVTV